MPIRSILVVEDDPNDENLTLRALRQCGVALNVVVARSAQETLDYLLRQGEYQDRGGSNPNVVFLDNTLPGSGGFELVARIRAYGELRSMPIVILSGSSDLNVVHKCALAGANSFLEKPLEMADYMLEVGNAAGYWLTLNLSPDPSPTSSYRN